MNNHNYGPREQRAVVMNDREIQEASRCYHCRGHHVYRFSCGTPRLSSQIVVAIATSGLGILAVLCAL